MASLRSRGPYRSVLDAHGLPNERPWASLWISVGFPPASRWIPVGRPRGCPWVLDGSHWISYAFSLVSHIIVAWIFYGLLMNSYGRPMGSLKSLHAYTMESQGMAYPCGCVPMGSLWIPSGLVMASQLDSQGITYGCPYGFSLDALYIPCGLPRDSTGIFLAT